MATWEGLLDRAARSPEAEGGRSPGFVAGGTGQPDCLLTDSLAAGHWLLAAGACDETPEGVSPTWRSNAAGDSARRAALTARAAEPAKGAGDVSNCPCGAPSAAPPWVKLEGANNCEARWAPPACELEGAADREANSLPAPCELEGPNDREANSLPPTGFPLPPACVPAGGATMAAGLHSALLTAEDPGREGDVDEGRCVGTPRPGLELEGATGREADGPPPVCVRAGDPMRPGRRGRSAALAAGAPGREGCLGTMCCAESPSLVDGRLCPTTDWPCLCIRGFICRGASLSPSPPPCQLPWPRAVLLKKGP